MYDSNEHNNISIKVVVKMIQQQVHRFCVETELTFLDTKLGNQSYFSDQKPICNGIDSDYHNLILDIIFGINVLIPFNFSIEIEPEDDACKKSMYENRSDIFMDHVMFNLNDFDLSSVDYLGFLYESRMHFVTGYTASNSTQFSNVLESFKSFSVFTWYLFGVIFWIIYFLLEISIKKLKKTSEKRIHKRLFFKMFSHFMKQSQLEEIDISFNGIIFLLILLTTFFHSMYNCLVHTDFIVVYKPFTPKTYQDIIDNKTALIYFLEKEYETFFEKRINTSVDRKFYDKIKHRKLDDMPDEYLQKYYKRYSKLEDSFEWINQLYGKHISFSSTMYAIDNVNDLCSFKVHIKEYLKSLDFKGNLDEVYPWISSDPDTYSIIQALLKRKNFKPHVGINKRISRIRQAGIQGMYKILIEKDRDYLFNSEAGLERKEKEMIDCLRFSRIIKMYDVEFAPLNYQNIKHVIYIFFGLFFIAFIILSIEHYYLNK